MAFYEDKREHYGGALVLFKRNLSVAVPNAKTHRRANWYMYLMSGGPEIGNCDGLEPVVIFEAEWLG